MAQQQLTRQDSMQNLPAIIQEVRNDLGKMAPQFKAVLPPTISPERFIRVVVTAIQSNPNLLRCTRRSLFTACLKAAEDGLLPDGREGVIIPFREDVEGGGKETNAIWVPMIRGFRKKVYESGLIKDWRCEVVYQGDEFAYELGDEPFIKHRPSGVGDRTRPITHVYSIAVFSDGTLARDVMTIGEVEQIRKRFARSQKGPWSDPASYSEMVRKTCARHHFKTLPTNRDIDRILSRDDALYDLERSRQAMPERQAARTQSLAEAFDHFGAGDEDAHEKGQKNLPAEGERTRAPAAAEPAAPGTTADSAGPAGAQDKAKAPAAAAATATKPAGPTMPKTPEDYVVYARATMAAAEGKAGAEQLLQWWPSEAQRKLRSACRMPMEQIDALASEWREHCAQLSK
jgi:recombination protein RecT